MQVQIWVRMNKWCYPSFCVPQGDICFGPLGISDQIGQDVIFN